MLATTRQQRFQGVLFGTVIFLAAFLLFGVQPLLSKAILPWFGGSSAVWTTCLLFFQIVLFGGYLYSHLLMSRLAPPGQAKVHLVVLGLPVAWLVLCLATGSTAGVIPNSSWRPTGDVDPTWRVLLLLGATIGLPYFVLSTTGPLLQGWFARLRPGVVPYRLYALSNAGSLLALLAYPFVIEPRWSLDHQGWAWSLLFLVFVVLCGMTAWIGRAEEGERAEKAEAVRQTTELSRQVDRDRSRARRLRHRRRHWGRSAWRRAWRRGSG